MDGFTEAPLLIGDRVRCEGYDDSPRGEIVESVADNYVRVLWEDCSVPLTHRKDSLVRDRDQHLCVRRPRLRVQQTRLAPPICTTAGRLA
jgi:hypothetical protein